MSMCCISHPIFEMNWQQGDVNGWFAIPENQWQQRNVPELSPAQCGIMAQQCYEDARWERLKLVGVVAYGIVASLGLCIAAEILPLMAAIQVRNFCFSLPLSLGPKIVMPLTLIMALVVVCVIYLNLLVFAINLWSQTVLPAALNCFNHANNLVEQARALEIRGAAEVVT